jgi:pimeloyl-ACP methyl ester carboxylesterase
MPKLDVDAARIHYEDVGDGEPVVLIHGAVSSGRCFVDHVPLLWDAFRVVVPDLRGMGRSDRVEDMPPSAWTDDTKELLDHLELERVHLCGTSLGARVALRMAVDLPDRVSSVAVDSPIMADSEEGSAALERVFGTDLTDEFAAQLRSWNGDDWENVRSSFLKLRRREGLQAHYDLREMVGGLQCPVLIARGDIDDPIHPLSDSLELHRRVDDSWLWIAPDTPFTALRNRPEHFVQIYRAFLDRVATVV